MKKSLKVISLVLAVIFSFSAFSVMALAEEDTVNVYENILKNVEKKGVVRTEVTEETWTEYDYSFLSDFNKSLTELRDGGEKKTKEESIEYFDAKNVDSETGHSEVYSRFSIKQDINSFHLAVGEKTYENNIIKIVAIDEYDDSKWTYEVRVNNGLISSYTLTKEFYETNKSIFFEEYNLINFEKVTYKFSYSEIPVKSITLSDDKVSIFYKESVKITATIAPDNASFAELRYVIKRQDGDVLVDEGVAYATKDGKATITVTGVGKGIVELEVYTMEGDFMDSCIVNVEFKPVDYIRFFFDKTIETINEMFSSFTF